MVGRVATTLSSEGYPNKKGRVWNAPLAAITTKGRKNVFQEEQPKPFDIDIALLHFLDEAIASGCSARRIAEAFESRADQVRHMDAMTRPWSGHVPQMFDAWGRPWTPGGGR